MNSLPINYVSIGLDYLTLDELLGFIKNPDGILCRKILNVNRESFEKAPGSTHNHQAWPGGYIDHVTDSMNYAYHLYRFDQAFGRPLSFSSSDALLVIFLHDLEKPWRITTDEHGNISNRPEFSTKAQYRAFREEKLREYAFDLTPEQMNALTYIEGEYPDYSSEKRTMNELAAFCHKVDVWSARGWHNYPKDNEPDGWNGAGRFRTKKIQTEDIP